MLTHPNALLAYLDPGTGSMVLQGVLAALAVVAFTVRIWWKKLLVLLGVRKPEAVPAPATAAAIPASQPAPAGAAEQHDSLTK